VREQLRGGEPAGPDAADLADTVVDLGQGGRVLLVDRRAQGGVEAHERVVRGGIDGGGDRGVVVEVHEGQVRGRRVVDGHDGVVDRRVHHGEVVGRMDGGELGAGRGLKAEQEPVPLHDGVGSGGRRGGLGRAGGRHRGADRGQGGGKRRAAEDGRGQRGERSSHEGHSRVSGGGGRAGRWACARP
jgi:hypothetical protein